MFLFTKSIPHGLFSSLAISHHHITNEMTPGAAVTSCTQSLSWHIWMRGSTICFQQISQLSVSPAAGLALIHDDLSNWTSQWCQWVLLTLSTILLVRRAGSASCVAVCVASALLRGSVSRGNPQLVQLQGYLWKSSLFSQQSVSMPYHPIPAQKRDTVMVKELYLSGHSSGCYTEKEFHAVISGPLSHVN